MKRHVVERDHSVEFDSISMANCLMLFSRGSETDSPTDDQSPIIRVFECKTCNRQFPSFQALGGHRASHKKPRLNNSEAADPTSPTKPKTHECSICGLEFAIGQALGGHMRRHRVVAAVDDYHHYYQYQSHVIAAPTTTMNLLPAATASMVTIVKKTQRQSVLSLDLNLTPFENAIELLRIGKAAPVIGCYI